MTQIETGRKKVSSDRFFLLL